MRFGTRWTLLLVVALSPFARPLSAQLPYSRPGRIYGEVSLVHVSFSGDSSMKAVHPGFGFDVAAVVPAQSPLMLAGGVRYTFHTVDQSSSFSAVQFYLEPRLVFHDGGSIVPYVSGHVGYIHTAEVTTLIDDTNTNVTGNAVQTGAAFGGGAGVMLRWTDHVRGSLSAGVERVSLGDIDFDFSHVGSSASHGTNIYVRLALSLEFSSSSALKSFLRR